MPEREIAFEGVLNFRDLGGYAAGEGGRVRWRRLFRSMTPEKMTEADLERARAELGIGLIIDLRGEKDLQGNVRTSGPMVADGARRVPVDFMRGMREERLPRPDGEVPETFFPWFIKVTGPEIARVIELLGTEDEVAMFHCHTGKDRTGMVAALALGLLGVDEEDIVTDYMMSAPYFEPMLDFLDMRERGPTDRFWLAMEPPFEGGIRAALATVREEYGGARNFLIEHGASEEALDAFVERMLE